MLSTATRSPGVTSARAAFRLAGARLVPLPLDEHGVDPAALDALARKGPVRAIYLTPHHQYPTTVTLSPGRRLQLLEIARAHRIAVVEDDFDHEFHYDGRPVLPLASVDRAGVVVYVGTLSKILAPSLRMVSMVARRSLRRASRGAGPTTYPMRSEGARIFESVPTYTTTPARSTLASGSTGRPS